MKTVFNVPRNILKNTIHPFLESKLDLVKKHGFAWVSVAEPDQQKTIISNVVLDQGPKLKLAFYDLTEEVPHKDKILTPPCAKTAKRIVDFLVEHRDKNVVANCAAGVSRSGAIAQFCHDFLGHKWDEFCRKCAAPNWVLYRLMANYYEDCYINTHEKFEDY